MRPSLLRHLAVLALAAFVLPAQAEQKTGFDDYIVRHSAIPSTFISEDIAREHDLVRSRSTGLLNVAVLEKDSGDDDPVPAVSAHLEGQMTNSVQQQKSLSFKRVREGDAVYYLAQFQYRDGEMLIFDLEVSPYDSEKTLPLRFSRELFHD